MKLTKLLLLSATALPLFAVDVTLNMSSQHEISPLIYGYNQEQEDSTHDEMNLVSRRLGGNRMSTFNWEINVDNSGEGTNSNWGQIKSLVGVGWNERYIAGESYRKFHQDNLDNGLTSIITVPIQGWIAADDDRTVYTGPHGSDSLRWNRLIYKKPTGFSLQPDTTDRVVYLDESVNFLVNSFGDATTETGVKYISLGNEPGLWHTTHELIQEEPLSAVAYAQKVIDAAKAVKAVDPSVKVIAGEFAGICIYDLKSAPDWSSVKDGYRWYPDYLLDQLKQASNEVGYPLIDVIAIHNYPQHKVDAMGEFSKEGTVVRSSQSTTDVIRKTRMDFARSMWDTAYVEPSWLTETFLGGESNAILVRLQKSIDTYFPGLTMMLGEFDYGHDADISHGIAMADLLGVMGNKGVEIATRWDTEKGNAGTYTQAAYKLYRNYDGNKATFGDIAIDIDFTDRDRSSAWASINSANDNLHLILLNKDITTSQTFSIALNSPEVTHRIKNVYGFDAQSAEISEKNPTVTVDSDLLIIEVPALSAYHVIVERTGVVSALTTPKRVLEAGEIIQHNNRVELLLPSGQKGTLLLCTPSGRVLFSHEGEFQEGRTTIPMSGLAKGVYITQFSGIKSSIVTKCIVE